MQTVLSDAALVEVARRRPASQEDLGRIRGAGSSSSGRRARELLDAVARARHRPDEPPPPAGRGAPPKAEDLPLVALCEALVRARAREAGLAYELLATKADLQAIVLAARTGEGAEGVRTLQGWRAQLVGDELLELLDGKISVSVRASQGTRQLRIERRE